MAKSINRLEREIRSRPGATERIDAQTDELKRVTLDEPFRRFNRWLEVVAEEDRAKISSGVLHKCSNCGLEYDVVTDETGFDITCPLCNAEGEEV